MSETSSATSTEFILNGKAVTLGGEAETPLLYVLRDTLGLCGTRFGCGEGTCGACTVRVDGVAVTSCDLPLSAVAGRAVETIEGFAEAEPDHPLIAALIEEQAGQCGYCLTGIVMTARGLVGRTPPPDRAEIWAALAGHLCRCGAHGRILRAIERAVDRAAGQERAS